jgi:hypothetical protein
LPYERLEGDDPSRLLRDPGGAGPAPPARGTAPRARIITTFGKRPIAKISADDVRRFLNGLEMSPRSANKQRQVLYAVFKYAVMRG